MVKQNKTGELTSKKNQKPNDYEANEEKLITVSGERSSTALYQRRQPKSMDLNRRGAWTTTVCKRRRSV